MVDILMIELSVTMALCGVNKVSEIGRQVIAGGPDSAAAPKKPAARKRKPTQS